MMCNSTSIHLWQRGIRVHWRFHMSWKPHKQWQRHPKRRQGPSKQNQRCFLVDSVTSGRPSNTGSLETKIRVYNSNVMSALLCGSECWRVMMTRKTQERLMSSTIAAYVRSVLSTGLTRSLVKNCTRGLRQYNYSVYPLRLRDTGCWKDT